MKYFYTFSAILFFASIALNTAHTPGTVTVDSFTFKKILRNFDVVLAKFDDKYREFDRVFRDMD